MTPRIVSGISGLLLVLCFSAMAEPGDVSIISFAAGECTLTVEANDPWRTLRLRAHHPKYRSCRITEDEMVSVLRAAFSKTETPRLEGIYSSLFIGRLIDFPWLSQHLAVSAFQDSEWNAIRGKPVAMDINAYASCILFDRKVLAATQAVLAQAGYQIAGVTVEKVLVGSFDEVPLYRGDKKSGRVPYDAQVWLRLEKN